MGNIVITLESMSTNEKSSFPSNTDYWSNLWDNYTNDYPEVVIHCWEEETDAIEELSARAVSVLNEGLMKIITVNLNEDNRLFFRNYSSDPKGGLKWFMMFFHIDGEERLEIGRYGSEIILYKVDEEEAEVFSAIFLPSAATSNFSEDYSD